MKQLTVHAKSISMTTAGAVELFADVLKHEIVRAVNATGAGCNVYSKGMTDAQIGPMMIMDFGTGSGEVIMSGVCVAGGKNDVLKFLVDVKQLEIGNGLIYSLVTDDLLATVANKLNLMGSDDYDQAGDIASLMYADQQDDADKKFDASTINFNWRSGFERDVINLMEAAFREINLIEVALFGIADKKYGGRSNVPQHITGMIRNGSIEMRELVFTLANSKANEMLKNIGSAFGATLSVINF